ncbi:MAG TPA: thioesterase family protein [Actinomycetota bacterium]|nr:thioesterase family protein [Actinomycetota bacterium]
MNFDFDRETAVVREGPGRFHAEISDRWNIFTVPNGGYLLSVVLDGVGRSIPHSDPISVTTHFMNRVVPGPAEIEVDVVRLGRAHSTATAVLRQDADPRMHVTATYGDLRDVRGPTRTLGERPAIPPPDECVKGEGGMASAFVEHFDLRLTPETAAWAMARPSGKGEMAGWIRFVDERPFDTRSLAVIADSFPPAVFNLLETGWVPTIELSVLMRARPVPGWLQCRFSSRYLMDGYVEEDGEVWDEAGTLVAMSRQLARVG